MSKESRSLRRLDVHVHRVCRHGLLLGVETVHAKKCAIAIQQDALDRGKIDAGHVSFKQSLILRSRACGQFGLVFKQSQDHSESHKEFWQVPDRRLREARVCLQQGRPGKHQSPDEKGSGGKNNSGAESAEAPEESQPGHAEETEEIKINSMDRVAPAGLKDRPKPVRQQQGGHSVQVHTLETVVTYGLIETGGNAPAQQRHIKPSLRKLSGETRKIQKRCQGDHGYESGAFPPVAKDFRNRKQEGGPREGQSSDL